MAVIFAVANQKAGGQDHDRPVARCRPRRERLASAARRSRPPGVSHLLPRLRPDALESSLHDVLIRRTKVDDVIRPVRDRGLFVLPATIDLAGAESTSCRAPARTRARPGLEGVAGTMTSSSSTAHVARCSPSTASRPRLRADPAAVRGPQPPRRWPVARDHRGRAHLRQRGPLVFGVIATCTTAEPATPAWCARSVQPLRPAPARAAGSQVGALRRGPELGRSILQHAPGSRVRPPTALAAQLLAEPAAGVHGEDAPLVHGLRWCVSRAGERRFGTVDGSTPANGKA